MKVYAVNSGCYSDYKIVAIFSSKKLAQEFMGAVKSQYSGYNDIEEYELNPKTADLINRGYSVWNVHMLKDGSTERVERKETDTYDVSNIGATIWHRSTAPAYVGMNKQDILTAHVWAKTKKQAVKITNEHRARMIASNEW